VAQLTLKAARRSVGWTQTRLAEEAGCAQTSIADIERGRNQNPSYKLVVALVAALQRGGLTDLQPEHIFGPAPATEPPVAEPAATAQG
jgi:DNA-binding XRE family transcriptional regulator